MAEIEARIHRVVIEEHPDAHSLELARIGGYRAVVRKGEVQDGDLVAYIPESSILPAGLIADMGLTGKLAGRDHNRVRAERIRGVVSQGLVWPMPHRQEGDDAADELGITKHLPEIPEYMRGQVVHAPGRTVRYDIQNIKKYPDVLQEGEEVVITEKIHGVQCQMGLYRGEPFVASKIYAAHGQVLIIGDVNADNIYVQAALRHMDDLRALAALPDGPGTPSSCSGRSTAPGCRTCATTRTKNGSQPSTCTQGSRTGAASWTTPTWRGFWTAASCACPTSTGGRTPGRSWTSSPPANPPWPPITGREWWSRPRRNGKTSGWAGSS